MFAVLQKVVSGVENEEWTTLESSTAQVSVDFQDVLSGSLHEGDYTEFFLSKQLSPPA
jgi:hypothetical protein